MAQTFADDDIQCPKLKFIAIEFNNDDFTSQEFEHKKDSILRFVEQIVRFTQNNRQETQKRQKSW